MTNFLQKLTWINSIESGVWMVLTFLMLWVLIKIYTLKGVSNKYFLGGILLLTAAWLYPYFSHLQIPLEIGVIGNVMVLALTLLHLIRLRELSADLSNIMVPQVLWVLTATLYAGLQLAEKYLS